MPFQVTCQDCGQSYSVGVEFAGKQVKCQNCGGSVAVPRRNDAVDQNENELAAEVEAVIVATRVEPHAVASVPYFQVDAQVLEARFSSGNTVAIAAWVHEFFCSQGYRLESGTSVSGVYGVGSDVMRFLFGAFARRYKFQVDVGASAEGVWISVAKGMSGAMGGLIGHSAMKRETKRIFESLQAFLRQRSVAT